VNSIATSSGGAADAGVVFKLDPAGHYTVLYSFSGGPDERHPGGVIRDLAGNSYGTTYGGGKHSTGVVFKLKPK
jgi:uncharacterized repeat protein (TIGR03803 family)